MLQRTEGSAQINFKYETTKGESIYDSIKNIEAKDSSDNEDNELIIKKDIMKKCHHVLPLKYERDENT